MSWLLTFSQEPNFEDLRWSIVIKGNEDVNMAYIDFTKAFDKGDHKILLNNVFKIDIRG